MKTHKVMSGLELLTKATQKLFKPKSLNLTETYQNELNRLSHERTQQTKGKEEGKKG